MYSAIDDLQVASISAETCIPWLERVGLTGEGRSYKPTAPDTPPGLLSGGLCLERGIRGKRTERKSKQEMDALRKTGRSELAIGPPETIWDDYKNGERIVKSLDIRRMPADALAFYRPFHFSPFEEWGIYIPVGPLMFHCEALYKCFQGKLRIFSPETLLSALLFEVFHHEYFHHLVESTATTLEILSAAFGEPRKIYLDFNNNGYEQVISLGKHPDHPLEEALANAYSYNSFSFLSRVRFGYKVALVRTYQKVIRAVWAEAGTGYQCASKYISNGYVVGAAQINAMLLSSATLDPASLMLLAKSVMPGGHTAFAHKADIPTYLVGNEQELDVFLKYVPTPSEAYTNLFWVFDTDPLDEFLRKRSQQEKRKTKNTSPIR